MLRHYHWVVWAYAREDPDTGNCVDNTVVDLVCKDRDEAMTRTRQLIPDKLYRIASVIEHFDGNPCGK